MSWSVSKVIRIESGEVTISVTDLKALLQFYGLQDETAIEGLLSLAKRARQRTWLNQYRDVASQQYLAYLQRSCASS
jgi:hypothetical protein